MGAKARSPPVAVPPRPVHMLEGGGTRQARTVRVRKPGRWACVRVRDIGQKGQIPQRTACATRRPAQQYAQRQSQKSVRNQIRPTARDAVGAACARAFSNASTGISEARCIRVVVRAQERSGGSAGKKLRCPVSASSPLTIHHPHKVKSEPLSQSEAVFLCRFCRTRASPEGRVAGGGDRPAGAW